MRVGGKAGTGVSATTAILTRKILWAALNRAVRDGLLARNVAAPAAPPKGERYEVQPWSMHEARALLAAAVCDRHEVLFTVALALGLRSSDVDPTGETPMLRVRLQVQQVEG